MSKEDIKELKELITNLSLGQKEMETSLIKKFDGFTEDIAKSISTISTKTEQLALEVKNLETKVDHFVDDEARTRNIILNGIPAKDGEDLAKIYNSLVANLGYDVEPEAKYFRFRGESELRSILIKFPTEFHKDDFMERYFKVATTLVLSKIAGFRKEGKTRIYLQHDFSPAQYKINKSAIKLRATGDVKAIRITHGKVGIKFMDKGPLFFFNTVDDLEKEAKKRKQPIWWAQYKK